MNIYLIGLPGVGKTTVGKKIAEKINYEFIDLDNYIELKATLFIDEIFKLYGEEYFRKLESDCLEEISGKTNVVVACGGGIIKNKKNKEYMNGPCIYLTSSLNEINNRLDNSLIERPLLLTKSLLDLYFERKELYEYFKDYEINNQNIDNTVKDIIEILGDKIE